MNTPTTNEFINNYTHAVNYVHTTIQLLAPVWKSKQHPEIETHLELAFKILTENPFYEGEKHKVN